MALNRQLVFDTVWNHLKAQGKSAMFFYKPLQDDFCAYRGEGGLKCAVGVLIPDDRYHEDLEGAGVLDNYSVLAAIDQKYGTVDPGQSVHDMYFLSELQDAHDGNRFKEGSFWWASVSSVMRAVAANYGLTVPEEATNA